MFSSIKKKRLVAAAKFLVAAKKKIVVPNFVASTKPFFPCTQQHEMLSLKHR